MATYESLCSLSSHSFPRKRKLDHFQFEKRKITQKQKETNRRLRFHWGKIPLVKFGHFKKSEDKIIKKNNNSLLLANYRENVC